MSSIPYVGEMLALAAPIAWSFAVILFRRAGEGVPPLALNLFKNSLATVLFALTMIALGQPIFRDVPRGEMILLLVSGAIGIGLSDAFFFMSLNRVGAGLHAIINTSYSPFIILLSYIFLHERLSPTQLFGVALILSAVLSVTKMRSPNSDPRSQLISGLILGLLFTLTQAISIVMVKPVLGNYPLLWSNLWRLVGGLGMSVLMLGFLPNERTALRALQNVRIWPVMIPGSVIGTYVALILWLGGMKYTQASTAAALNQTSTLWTFLLAVLLLHEPLTRRRLVGLGAGLVGAAFVTFG